MIVLEGVALIASLLHMAAAAMAEVPGGVTLCVHGMNGNAR